MDYRIFVACLYLSFVCKIDNSFMQIIKYVPKLTQLHFLDQFVNISWELDCALKKHLPGRLYTEWRWDRKIDPISLFS